MQDRLEAEAILALWHGVERELEIAVPGSDEETELLDEWADLRARHARLTNEARRRHGALPPAWPEPETGSTRRRPP